MSRNATFVYVVSRLTYTTDKYDQYDLCHSNDATGTWPYHSPSGSLKDLRDLRDLQKLHIISPSGMSFDSAWTLICQSDDAICPWPYHRSSGSLRDRNEYLSYLSNRISRVSVIFVNVVFVSMCHFWHIPKIVSNFLFVNVSSVVFVMTRWHFTTLRHIYPPSSRDGHCSSHSCHVWHWKFWNILQRMILHGDGVSLLKDSDAGSR